MEEFLPATYIRSQEMAESMAYASNDIRTDLAMGGIQNIARRARLNDQADVAETEAAREFITGLKTNLVATPQVIETNPNQERQRNEWLDQEIADLETTVGSNPGAARVLDRENKIVYVRDLFVLGRQYVMNIRGIGRSGPSTRTESIEQIIQNSFGLRWLDEPTVKDIATFCCTPSEIHADVLTGRFGPKICNSGERLTVTSLIREMQLVKEKEGESMHGTYIRRLRAAEEFKDEFNLARMRLRGDL